MQGLPVFTGLVRGAAQPQGHYSSCVRLPNGIVLLAGQKAWHPVSGELSGNNVAEQTSIIFDNLRRILDAHALTIESIVRISCHLSNVDDYDAFNTEYARQLGSHKPVRTVLAGYRLRGGALVELVAEAFGPDP